ncbi:hypothetical protein LJB83_00985 [Clostridia bacterium OttesenSCG-928-F22]|nr:hypothetical protein [Clostridia bacterium OttesenSCG-928-F22]
MDIRQCKMCNKLFHYISKPICNECSEEMDRMFIKVRNYLYEKPNADITEISEKTEVPEKYILDFLKEERLSLQTVSGLLVCEKCGKPIEKGTFCEGCKQELSQALEASIAPKKTAGTEEKSQDAYASRRQSKMHLNYKE